MAEGSGDRIVAALGERMTARDACRPHPPTPQPAVLFDRFIRVHRARGVIAARRRKQLGKRLLVAAYQNEQNPCHTFNFESLSAASSVSALSSSKDTSSAAGRAIRTTSYRIPRLSRGESGPSSLRRTSSRSRRLARLRRIEPFTVRLTVTPIRFSSLELGTAKATRLRPLKTRFPPIAAWNSPCRRSR